MREIKFRAWNLNTQAMVDLQKISSLALDSDDLQGLFIPRDDSLIIMQYTGLKDRNGREIYEGDIVKTLLVYCKNPPIGQVKFEEGFFTIKWIDDDNQLSEWLYTHIKDCEVIGNIYENGDLVK